MNRSLTRRLPALAAVAAISAVGLGAPAQAQYDADRAPRASSCLERDHHDHGSAARGERPDDHGDLTVGEREAVRKETRRLLRQRGIAPGRAALASQVTVKVYVHVIRDDNGNGDVSDEKIAQQIAVLNKTFAGEESTAASDTGFRFELAGTDRFDETSWHHDRSGSRDTAASLEYREATRKGGAADLNIWFVNLSGLGIATFPWEYRADGAVDGIRVDYTTVPGGSADNYDLGETTTHEAGHWFGLYHTFEDWQEPYDDCDPVNDEVDDTPIQRSASSGCPTDRDSCPAPGSDPIHNYMDYSYDECYDQFTPGQTSRMAELWSAYRA